MSEFIKGDNAVDPFTIFDSPGVPINADVTPVIDSIRVNSSYPTIAGAAITQVLDSNGAAKVGVYEVSVPTSSLAVGDFVDVTYSATVGGANVGPMSFVFQVRQVPFDVTSDVVLTPTRLS